MKKALILVNNMIEYYKAMNNVIEKSDAISVEAAKSVFDFSISNLKYLAQILEGEK